MYNILILHNLMKECLCIDIDFFHWYFIWTHPYGKIFRNAKCSSYGYTVSLNKFDEKYFKLTVLSAKDYLQYLTWNFQMKRTPGTIQIHIYKKSRNYYVQHAKYLCGPALKRAPYYHYHNYYRINYFKIICKVFDQ